MQKTIVNPVIKDVATFIKSASESDGTVSEIEITLSQGGGNVLHYHKTYSETFTAVDGDLGLKLGKSEQKVILKPGESYTVQPMELHCFFNPGNEQIKFNIKIVPGHKGFENSLCVLYGLAKDGLTNNKSIPKNLTHTAIVICLSDMNAPGFLTLIFPLLKWLYKRAQNSGEEQRLITKYCN